MDEQIHRVQKAVKSGKKKTAQKQIKKLLRMDKKFDAKLEKCGKERKAVKSHLKDDIKTFKKEAKDDKKLIKKIK